MKKIYLYAPFLLLLAFVSCKNKENESQEDSLITSSNSEIIENYTISFDLNGGEGDLPTTINSLAAGENYVIPNLNVIKSGYDFLGFTYNDKLYEIDDNFTMPAENVVFIATYEKIAMPAFSQSKYAYDKLVGGDFEIPFDSAGYTIYYLEVNGNDVESDNFKYDEETKCIILDEDYILSLTNGNYSLKAITDADGYLAATCNFNLTNSLRTNLLSDDYVSFSYGKDNNVKFNFDFNGTNVKKIIGPNGELDSSFFFVDANNVYLSGEYLKRYSGETEYQIYLTNNEVYPVTIKTNVIFYTDYDAVTIHDKTISDTGQNSLYQYSSNVSIVDDVANMDGKVLKYQPNYEDVTYSCHGIYTLRSSSWSATWYEAKFDASKYYLVSFDYMTVDTVDIDSVEFMYKSVSSNYANELILGENNVVHHFQDLIVPGKVGNGLYLWAYFNGGSGYFYVDNFLVCELDDVPSIPELEKATIGEDYSFNFDSKNSDFTLWINEKEIKYSYDGNKVLLDSEALEGIKGGKYDLVFDFNAYTISSTIQIIDPNSNASLNEVTANYKYDEDDEVRFYGDFSNDIFVSSLTFIDDVIDSGYENWDFSSYTSDNLAKYATITPGKNNSGYLTISKELCDMVYGTKSFTIEFSDGSNNEISITSDVVAFTNFDEVILKGYYCGVYNPGSPLNSGMWGSNNVTIEEREAGNEACYSRTTEGSGANCLFTLKFHEHVWDWYRIYADENHNYRITFDYQINDLANNSAYFYIMIPENENINEAVFGDYDEIIKVTDYYEVRWYLNNDGQVHSFDSGLFTYNSDLRMCQICLPFISASSESYVMVDNYRVISKEKEDK